MSAAHALNPPCQRGMPSADGRGIPHTTTQPTEKEYKMTFPPFVNHNHMINKLDQQTNELSQIMKDMSPNAQASAKRRVAQEYNLTQPKFIHILTAQELSINLQVYREEHLQEQQFEAFCADMRNRHLPATTLYTSPEHQTLNVSTFLDVAKYAVSVADVLGYNVGKISSIITGLKVVNRITNPKSTSHDDISLVAELIAEAGKYYASNDHERNTITLTSTAFSLAEKFVRQSLSRHGGHK